MIARIGLDLEVGLHIARVLPGLDLLDVAYGAVHGGVQVLMFPVTAFVTSAAETADLFDRPGLPLLAVKCELGDLDRIPGLGPVPDRIVVVGDGGRIVTDVAGVAAKLRQVVSPSQETAVLVNAEAAPLKELARARIQWAFFSTEAAFRASSSDEMQAEVARLSSAALAAGHVGLRVALLGPTGRHLPPALAALSNIEEIFPVPDLWAMALRSGWEKAVAEYARLYR